jgi:tRNA(adenine34) deaminase
MMDNLIGKYGDRQGHMRIFATALLLIFCLAFVCQGEESGKMARNNSSLEEIQAAIEAFSPKKPADRFALITLQEALAASMEGNFGYGACLVNESTGEVVERGHNHVFHPYFRSDLHAEMDVLDKYEDRMKAPVSRADGLALYLSGEPSPMGLVRIISAGITKMHYLAPVPQSGMGQTMDCLPPLWREMAKGRVYGLADSSPELRNLSMEIINYSNKELVSRLESA